MRALTCTPLRRTATRRLSCSTNLWVPHDCARPVQSLQDEKGLFGSGCQAADSMLNWGRKIAHRKSAPHKSSWIFSGVFHWLSVTFSNSISFISGSVKRIVTFPVDFHWKYPMDFQLHFPMEFHFCHFWCASFSPRSTNIPRDSAWHIESLQDRKWPDQSMFETLVGSQGHLQRIRHGHFPRLALGGSTCLTLPV